MEHMFTCTYCGEWNKSSYLSSKVETIKTVECNRCGEPRMMDRAQRRTERENMAKFFANTRDEPHG